MRTTVDLPDSLFRDLKVAAARRGMSMKSLVTRALEKELGVRRASAKARARVRLPLIRARRPGTLNLTNTQIEELLG